MPPVPARARIARARIARARTARAWVKGQHFSTANVFGRQGQRHASLFANGSLAIFRLSPQVCVVVDTASVMFDA